MADAARAPSPEALADLKQLAREYDIDSELIQTLITCKEQSRTQIRFYKRMMFVSNGTIMTVGLALAGFGWERLSAGSAVTGGICLAIGALLFLKFTAVFASTVKAIWATEIIARKHNLI